MWVWKRKKGKTLYHQSIGAKKRYYEEMMVTTPSKKGKAKKGLKRLERYQRDRYTFGRVFITKDSVFNPRAPRNKSRRVVCVGASEDGMKVIPIRKNNNMISLSQFDGIRSINVNHVKSVPFDQVYEKNTFPRTQNDYLTASEKRELYKKLPKRR